MIRSFSITALLLSVLAADGCLCDCLSAELQAAELKINAPARVSLGEPIELSTDFEAKAYRWEPRSSAKLIALPGNKVAHAWALEGRHSFELTAVTDDYQLHRGTCVIDVVNAPLPPAPQNLRNLVDDSTAKLLADYFTGISRQVGKTTTPEKFWAAFDATFPVNSNAKLVQALRERLTVALTSLDTLADSLRKIADEFKGSPDPSPLPPTPAPEPKPTPPPIPVPVPIPTPVPDDTWGVAKTTAALVSSMGIEARKQAAATAVIYELAADQLEDGRLASIGTATDYIKSERRRLWGSIAPEWGNFESAVSDTWDAAWPLNKVQAIAFIRAVASGLKAVN